MNAFKEFTKNLVGTKNPALYKKLIHSNYSRFIKWEKQNEYPFLYSRSPLFSLFFDQAFQFYKKRMKIDNFQPQFPVFINTNKNKIRLKTSLPYGIKQIGSGVDNQNEHFGPDGNSFSHYYKAKDMEQRFINLLMVSGKKKKANQIFVTAENKFTLTLEKVMESEKTLSITPLSFAKKKHHFIPKQSNEKISTLILSRIKLKTELLVSTKQKQIEKGDLFPINPETGKNIQEKREKDGSRKKNGDPVSSNCLSLQKRVGLPDTNKKGCEMENNLQQTSPSNLLDTPRNDLFKRSGLVCGKKWNTDKERAVGGGITTTETQKLSLLSLNLQDKLLGYQPHFSSSPFCFPNTTGCVFFSEQKPQTCTQKRLRDGERGGAPYDYSILQKKYKKGGPDFKIEQSQSNQIKGEVSTLPGTKSIGCFATAALQSNSFLCSEKKTGAKAGTGSGAEKNGKKAKSSLSVYLQKAVENVTPNLEIRKVRIGRKTYQVPALISQKKGEGLAIRWIIDAATQSNKNSNADFSDSLAQELLLAYNKKGQARQKRDELHKIAQANRAYIRYRWW